MYASVHTGAGDSGTGGYVLLYINGDSAAQVCSDDWSTDSIMIPVSKNDIVTYSARDYWTVTYFENR